MTPPPYRPLTDDEKRAGREWIARCRAMTKKDER